MSHANPEVGDILKAANGTIIMLVSEDNKDYTDKPTKFMWLSYTNGDYVGAVSSITFTPMDADTYLGNIRDLLPKIAKVLDSNS